VVEPSVATLTSSLTVCRFAGSSNSSTGSPVWVGAVPRLNADIDQLLIRVPGESPSGRVPIYICAECGELGCGAITGVLERTSEGFVWRDFVFESGSDLAVVDARSFERVGPFLFNKHEYWQLLSGRLGAL
jgi:hypothetical protein